MQAYVLVQTWPEGAPAVIEAARVMPHIVAAEPVQGPFDVIVRVPAEDVKQVALSLLGLDETIRALVRHPRVWSADPPSTRGLPGRAQQVLDVVGS